MKRWILALVLGLALPVGGVLEAQGPAAAGDDTPRAVVTGRSPGIGDFFPDLARNARGLLARENLLPLLVGAGGVAVTHPADDSVNGYFGRANRLGPLEAAGNQGGRALVVASAASGLMLVGQLQGDARFRRFSYDLAQASALDGLITQGMKAAVRRSRPTGDSRSSFPSGHTSSAFTIATVAARHYGWPGAIAGYVGATLVGVSRLDAEKHYLSDVVAGATLGIIVGRTTTTGGDQRYARLAWTPVLSPGTRTVGLSVTWNLRP